VSHICCPICIDLPIWSVDTNYVTLSTIAILFGPVKFCQNCLYEKSNKKILSGRYMVLILDGLDSEMGACARKEQSLLFDLFKAFD